MASRLAERTAVGFSLRCWGGFVLRDAEGQERRPRGRKARAVLAYLAMHPDRRVGRERLTELLWGDRGEEQARSSLRQSLFELKEFGNGAGLLVVERDGVTLNGAALATDLGELRAAAEAQDYPRLLAALPEPDDTLFAGLDGLGESFDAWLRIERTVERDALVQMIADASAQAVARAQVREARALHARLLAFEPELDQSAPAIAPVAGPVAQFNPVGTARPASRRGVLALGAGALAVAGYGSWWVGNRATPVRAEARDLYEAAAAIVYERRFHELPVAIKLLRRALAVEPGYAPTWAALASATAMTNRTPEGLFEAEKQARHAIALDPGYGKGHGVLGMVLGFDTDEARASIKRAAALSPRDAEILYWLSQVHLIEGDFTARLEALRRAAAIDPLWHRSSGTAALTAWELGHAAEARQHIERVTRIDQRAGFNCNYSVDWGSGAFAEVVRTIAAARPRLAQADLADWKLGNALLILGHVEPARLLLRLPPELWEVASGGPPSAASLVRINREAELSQPHSFCQGTAICQTVKAGRGAELVRLYEARQGALGKLARNPTPISLMTGGPFMAQAFRQAGQPREAEQMLDRTEAALRRSYDAGAVPNWLESLAAQTWALRGRNDEALQALTRAVDRGWHFAPVSPMPDIANIHAFARLRGHPEFEAQRARLRAHLERERESLGPVPV